MIRSLLTTAALMAGCATLLGMAPPYPSPAALTAAAAPPPIVVLPDPDGRAAAAPPPIVLAPPGAAPGFAPVPLEVGITSLALTGPTLPAPLPRARLVAADPFGTLVRRDVVSRVVVLHEPRAERWPRHVHRLEPAKFHPGHPIRSSR